MSRSHSLLARLLETVDISPALQERVYEAALWSGFVMALLGFVLYKTTDAAPELAVWIQAGSWLLLLSNWWLGRRQKIQLASNLLIVGFWFLINVLIFTELGQASLWLIPQFLLVLLSRYLVNGRLAFILTALTAIFDLSLYGLVQNNLLPVQGTTHTSAYHTIPVAISILLVFLLFRVTDILHRETVRLADLSRDRYQSLFEFTNDGVFLIGADYTYAEANQSAADLLGLSREQVRGKSIFEVIPRDEEPAVRENFEQLKQIDSLPLFERTFIRPDGSRRTAEVSTSVVKDEAGEFQFYQSVTRDITERKRLEQELRLSLKKMETLAMQDPLTGLLNRRAITEHAEAEWHRSRRERRPMCVALVDLDNLKDVNDNLGHLVGDQVIAKLSEVIKNCLRRYDWAGRWGGDEFLLVLPGANLMEAQAIAERIREAYANSDLVTSIDADINPYLSMGIAVFSGRPGDDSDPGDLFGMADKALYAAKQAGKNRIEIYRDAVVR